MKCQKCGQENEKGAQFCDNCGTQLVPKPVIPMAVSAEPRQASQFPKVCSNCGTRNAENDKFCDNCGTELSGK